MKTIPQLLHCSAPLFSAIAWAALAVSAQAANWCVDNNPNIPALPGHFTTLAAAHAAAANDDTILFAGSATPYASMTVTKRLNLVGVGYLLAENGVPSANTNEARITPAITFSAGSEGSTATGLRLDGISIQVNNAVVARCWAQQITVGNVSGVLIKQCIGQGGITVNGSGNVISNCIQGTYRINGANNAVSQCILGYFDVSGLHNLENTCSLTNSIVLRDFNGSNFSGTVSNCMDERGRIPSGNGNILFANVGFTGGSEDMQHRLGAGSPAIGAGLGGVDMGAFGGPAPYLMSGLPPRPRIKVLTSGGLSSTTTGLRVHVEAESKN